MKTLIYVLFLLSYCLSVSGQLIDPQPIETQEKEFIKKNRIRESRVSEFTSDGKNKKKTTDYEVNRYDTNGNLVYSIIGDRDKKYFRKDIYEYTYNGNEQFIMEKYTNYSSMTKINFIAYTKYEYENGHLMSECHYDSAMRADGYKPCYTFIYRNDTLIAHDKYNDCILEYKGDSIFQKTRYSGVLQEIFVKGKVILINTNDGYEYTYEYNEDGLLSKACLINKSVLSSTSEYTYSDGILVSTAVRVGDNITYFSRRYSYKYYR